MTKRTQLNRWKKNVLKDLNMFVSPLRLCVRNLPNHLTKDAALRVIIKKHCNDPNAKVTGTEMTADTSETLEIEHEITYFLIDNFLSSNTYCFFTIRAVARSYRGVEPGCCC